MGAVKSEHPVKTRYCRYCHRWIRTTKYGWRVHVQKHRPWTSVSRHRAT